MNQMNPKNFIICSSYSQCSGKPLNKPVIHQENSKNPCYFNIDEQTNQDCPVCQKQFPNPIVDQKFQQVLIQKAGKQIIKSDDQFYYIDKSPYSQYALSEDQEIRVLQQQMEQHVCEKNLDYMYDLYQNDLLEKMQQMTKESQKSPLLVAIVSSKIVLFYHTLKIRISLPIFLKRKAVTTQYSQLKGEIKQIIKFADKIFALHCAQFENQHIYALYAGELKQVYENQSSQSKKFLFTQMSQYTLNQSAHLVVLSEEKLLMIGSDGYYVIKDIDCVKPNNESQEKKYKIQMEDIQQNSKVFYIDNQLIIISPSNNNRLSVNVYLFDSMKHISSRQILYNRFDLILPFDKQLKMVDSKQLNQNFVDSISFPGNDQMITFCSVANHSNFMLVKPCISTVTQLSQICCCIVQLQLDEYHLPAILVYNIPKNCFEIELI